MAKKKRKKGKGRIVISKSGRRYRKSPRSKHGYVLIGKKKRHAKKRKSSKRHAAFW